MKYYFSSDYHLGHFNIIRYCNRPFKSLEQMNETIIRNHNERIKKEDILFHIGDFCFKNTSNKGEGIRKTSAEWESQLNGKIIHIMGNHDRNNSTKTIIQKCGIKYGNKRINLVHNPEHCDFDYNINFTGHKHEKWEIKRIEGIYKITDCINVGVDVWKFMPVTFEEINKRYSKWLREGNFEKSI